MTEFFLDKQQDGALAWEHIVSLTGQPGRSPHEFKSVWGSPGSDDTRNCIRRGRLLPGGEKRVGNVWFCWTAESSSVNFPFCPPHLRSLPLTTASFTLIYISPWPWSICDAPVEFAYRAYWCLCQLERKLWEGRTFVGFVHDCVSV